MINSRRSTRLENVLASLAKEVRLPEMILTSSRPPSQHRTTTLTSTADRFTDTSRAATDVLNHGPQNLSPKENMNANGAHHPHRPQQQVQAQRDRRSHGVDLPVNNGISHGPMQSHIQVAKPFVFHQAIEGCLDDLCVAVTRDEQYRIAGVRWIDDVRKALKLYV